MDDPRMEKRAKEFQKELQESYPLVTWLVNFHESEPLEILSDGRPLIELPPHFLFHASVVVGEQRITASAKVVEEFPHEYRNALDDIALHLAHKLGEEILAKRESSH